MRQRDCNFALGETQLASFSKDVILFSRFYQSDNKISGAVSFFFFFNVLKVREMFK